jgi:hypothetical protein
MQRRENVFAIEMKKRRRKKFPLASFYALNHLFHLPSYFDFI